VEQQNILGIYLAKTRATVVCVKGQGHNAAIEAAFEVVGDAEAENVYVNMVEKISAGCAEKQLTFGNVSIALDCSMYMQHKLHSEFSDQRRIAQTIRFDTEEALATDVSDVAIAFRIVRKDQDGSDLTVFTAKKPMLQKILNAFQSFNLDPIAIEPDIQCLGRFLGHNIDIKAGDKPFLAVVSENRCYFLVCENNNIEKPLYVRTFLLGTDENPAELLRREIPMTLGQLPADNEINAVYLAQQNRKTDTEALGEILDMPVNYVDIAANTNDSEQDCVVNSALACGAAAVERAAAEPVNFRDDFSPYQGRKKRIEKALKFASISVCVLLLALGVYGQAQFFHRSKPVHQLREKFAQDYSQVMMGDPLPSRPIYQLNSTKRRIESIKRGQLSITGEESISARLTLVLQAFNSCASRTNLEIDSISITTRNITVAGSTSSERNTLELRNALQDAGLAINRETAQSRGGRNSFTFTLEPKEG